MNKNVVRYIFLKSILVIQGQVTYKSDKQISCDTCKMLWPGTNVSNAPNRTLRSRNTWHFAVKMTVKSVQNRIYAINRNRCNNSKTKNICRRVCTTAIIYSNALANATRRLIGLTI